MARVLVADDSATMRKMICRALRSAGVSEDDMVAVANGAEALAYIESTPPDLLVSDVNMPVMDGRTLLSELRARSVAPDLKIAMVTSVSASRVLVELARLGADKIVRKPFTPTELGAVLTDLLKEPAAPAPTPPNEAAPPTLDALDHAVIQVLGDLAFIDAQPHPTDVPGRSVMYRAAVQMTEPSSVRLELLATRMVTKELASNLVGEPAVDDMDCLDALGELANVLAGAIDQPVETEDSGFGLPMVDVVGPGRVASRPRAFCLDGDPDSCLFVNLTDEAA